MLLINWTFSWWWWSLFLSYARQRNFSHLIIILIWSWITIAFGIIELWGFKWGATFKIYTIIIIHALVKRKPLTWLFWCLCGTFNTFTIKIRFIWFIRAETVKSFTHLITRALTTNFEISSWFNIWIIFRNLK